MDSFELLDVFLFIGVSQGLYLAIALQTVTNKNKSANLILSKILLIAAFMLFGRIIYFRYANQILRQIADYADFVIFMFGPLIYVYIRRITFNENKTYKLPLYHYIPVVFIVIFSTWKLFYPGKEFYLMLKAKNINLGTIYHTIEILAIISNFNYLYKSSQLIKLHKTEEKNNGSTNQSLTSFLITFLSVTFGIILLWLIGLCNRYFGIHLSFINYDMIWISIPILVYLVGYYSLKQPEIFRAKLNPEKKKTRKRLDEKVLLQLQEKLNLLMQDEKIYLDNQLTLRSLAEKLNTSSNNLSWLLNSVYNCTFYEYINRSRIKTFITKIENGEHKEYTVLALSIDSGFNSKSTFNKAFKAEMNDTPTNYIKNLNIN